MLKLIHRQQGFTIVELLIVIVVIGILAAISIVAYNNIQQMARDGQRAQDIKTITKALEMYYIDNGKYPGISGGSTMINGSWATTNDVSWAKLEEALVPKYISMLPKEPRPSSANPQSSGVLGYAYFSNNGGVYCGSGNNQMYILIYTLESGKKELTSVGECSVSPLSYNNSHYRVARH